ncbi:hypothetical protein ZWY2020_001763 [Hordeum vulgare]|nr:hypothetical protein ZWY2020_001763 [Hordeum vulgare]
MAIDAPALHAHSRSGRSDGAGTVASWPSPAAPLQITRPKRKGMLTWRSRGPQISPPSGKRKEGGRKGLPKVALPVASTHKAALSSGGDDTADGIGTAGGPSLADGLEAPANSNSGALPTTEEDPIGSAPATADPMPCQDRYHLRQGPASLPVGTDELAPPTARSGQSAALLTFVAPALPSTPLDQSPWPHVRANEERAGSEASFPVAPVALRRLTIASWPFGPRPSASAAF